MRSGDQEAGPARAISTCRGGMTTCLKRGGHQDKKALVADARVNWTRSKGDSSRVPADGSREGELRSWPGFDLSRRPSIQMTRCQGYVGKTRGADDGGERANRAGRSLCAERLQQQLPSGSSRARKEEAPPQTLPSQADQVGLTRKRHTLPCRVSSRRRIKPALGGGTSSGPPMSEAASRPSRRRAAIAAGGRSRAGRLAKARRSGSRGAEGSHEDLASRVHPGDEVRDRAAAPSIAADHDRLVLIITTDVRAVGSIAC
jgi:hypothetical protein